MKQNFRHEFLGYGRFTSACNVHINSDDNGHYILFEDIDEGTSVTNASEQIATEVVEMLNLDPDDCTFYERYPHTVGADEITYTWKDNKASNPKWRPRTDFVWEQEI